MPQPMADPHIIDLEKAFALPELVNAVATAKRVTWSGPDPVKLLEEKLRRRDDLLLAIPSLWQEGRYWEVSEQLPEFVEIAGRLRPDMEECERLCQENPELVSFCHELTDLEKGVENADWQQCADILPIVVDVCLDALSGGDSASPLLASAVSSVVERGQRAASMTLHNCGSYLTQESCVRNPSLSLAAARCSLILSPGNEQAESIKRLAEANILFSESVDLLLYRCTAAQWTEAENICAELVNAGRSSHKLETMAGTLQIGQLHKLTEFRLALPAVTLFGGLKQGRYEEVAGSLDSLAHLCPEDRDVARVNHTLSMNRALRRGLRYSACVVAAVAVLLAVALVLRQNGVWGPKAAARREAQVLLQASEAELSGQTTLVDEHFPGKASELATELRRIGDSARSDPERAAKEARDMNAQVSNVLSDARDLQALDLLKEQFSRIDGELLQKRAPDLTNGVLASLERLSASRTDNESVVSSVVQLRALVALAPKLKEAQGNLELIGASIRSATTRGLPDVLQSDLGRRHTELCGATRYSPDEWIHAVDDLHRKVDNAVVGLETARKCKLLRTRHGGSDERMIREYMPTQYTTLASKARSLEWQVIDIDRLDHAFEEFSAIWIGTLARANHLAPCREALMKNARDICLHARADYDSLEKRYQMLTGQDFDQNTGGGADIDLLLQDIIHVAEESRRISQVLSQFEETVAPRIAEHLPDLLPSLRKTGEQCKSQTTGLSERVRIAERMKKEMEAALGVLSAQQEFRLVYDSPITRGLLASKLSDAKLVELDAVVFEYGKTNRWVGLLEELWQVVARCLAPQPCPTSLRDGYNRTHCLVKIQTDKPATETNIELDGNILPVRSPCYWMLPVGGASQFQVFALAKDGVFLTGRLLCRPVSVEPVLLNVALQACELPAPGQQWLLTDNTAFQWIPMSNKEEPTDPVHALQRGVWLAQTELTVGQWQEFRRDRRGAPDDNIKSGSLPVTHVTLEEAQQYCRWLNQREKQAERLPLGLRYRLPTVLEWRWACQGGAAGTRFWWGDDKKDIKNRANFYDLPLREKRTWFSKGWHDGFDTTSPTDAFGRHGRNRYGLADMIGNVSEWCTGSPGSSPMVCGGSFRTPLDEIGSSLIAKQDPYVPADDVGFRLCLGLPADEIQVMPSKQ